MNKTTYHIIGVMSGTSLDGIDLAEMELTYSNNRWSFQLQHCETVSYSQEWREKLRNGINLPEQELYQLDVDYTQKLSEEILSFIQRNKIQNLDAVCSHGHTILHQPDEGITYQIGNRPEIAKIIGQTVVCDFRVQDVQLGGQGAPLVPIGDRLLFSEYDACLNLGGFANISFEQNQKRIAYDVCPVNIVMNPYAQKLGMEYDDSGRLAKSGKIDSALLDALNVLPFYSFLAPKSLGLEWVREQVFPLLESSGLSPQDILRTFVEHVAIQLSAQFSEDDKVLVTGGGAYNSFLIGRLKNYTSVRVVVPDSKIIEYKEALVFGLLGVLKLRGEINCLSSVTGAQKDHSSGVIHTP